MVKLKRLWQIRVSPKTLEGKISLFSSKQLKVGKTIVTKYGHGRITIIDENHNKNSWLTIRLSGNQYKSIKERNTYIYVLYNAKQNKFVPLSGPFYNYIEHIGQIVQYKITSKGFARLLPKCVKQNEAICMINKRKYGYSLLRSEEHTSELQSH